ncbi:MAG: hypothetical protein KAX99_05065, partial [Azonexus sp.]|nr:hypothetical protein [Azonexus sp.]
CCGIRLLSWRSGVYPFQPDAATPSALHLKISRTVVREGGDPAGKDWIPGQARNDNFKNSFAALLIFLCPYAAGSVEC